LLSEADIARVRAELERVIADSDRGVCLFCSPRRARAERKREAERYLKPRKASP
jgi:hypothetical protein